jgi:hypothetical protein
MMGKILGLASVGLLQFTIWIVLISTLSTLIFASFGLEMPQQQMADQMSAQGANPSEAMPEFFMIWSQIPFAYIIFTFIFYFIGGYLLYGALFAAVGSSVDSPAEAQQFTFPITIPLLISYLSLFTFILNFPHEPVSVWLSIISIYVTHRDDRKNCFRCTHMAISLIDDFTDWWFCLYNLDSRKNLQGRNFDARYKGKLQGYGKVVYDEALSSRELPS